MWTHTHAHIKARTHTYTPTHTHTHTHTAKHWFRAHDSFPPPVMVLKAGKAVFTELSECVVTEK